MISLSAAFILARPCGAINEFNATLVNMPRRGPGHTLRDSLSYDWNTWKPKLFKIKYLDLVSWCPRPELIRTRNRLHPRLLNIVTSLHAHTPSSLKAMQLYQKTKRNTTNSSFRTAMYEPTTDNQPAKPRNPHPPSTAAPHPTTAARLGLRPQEIFLHNPRPAPRRQQKRTCQ